MTLNVNGIRSAARKGFFEWLNTQAVDVVCLQEIKAHADQLTDPIYYPSDYHCFYVPAQQKGYSGVAIYTRQKPDRVITQLGFEPADSEGRYVQIDLGLLSIASIYLPSGSSGPHRQAEKFKFLAHYLPLLKQQRAEGREFLLCGDWNIAHTQKDLKNWRGNQKNSGFLPEERAWLDELFGEAGYVDAFRCVNQEEDQYTWWSNRGQAWAKNVGWRIDYHIVTPGLKSAVKAASIYKDTRFSDHAPLVIEYKRDN